MPFKPKKPCKYPGCNKLTDGRYCTEHLRLLMNEYNKHHRNQQTQAVYISDEWQRIREEHLISYPFCQVCKRYGRLIRASEVHHIVPLADGGSNKHNNLLSVCHRCHMKLHAERGELFGRGKVYSYSHKHEDGSD